MGQAAVPFLAKALAHRHGAVRQKASEALANSNRNIDEVIPALVKALDDPLKEVRSNAARALGYARAPSKVAVSALIRSLNDIDYVRRHSVSSLGTFGAEAKEAIPTLVDLKKVLGDDINE